MNVLIVDDASFIRKALTRILTEEGHNVIAEAETGVDGVAKYKLYSPDLVILDIAMPDMDGYEALRQIMEADSNAKVIMCSSLGQKERVMDAVQNGAKGFIVKPFVVDDVKNIVRKMA